MDVIVLGATGSIGRQTADVIRSHPDRLRARGLVSRRDWSGMVALARTLKPDWVYLEDQEAADRAATELPATVALLEDAAQVQDAIAAAPAGTAVVAAMSGLAGLDWVMTAAAAGLRLCLANKETLVAAGAPVTEAVRRHGATLLPVDSEHSALMQAIGAERDAVARLILTCSGGPFRGWPADRLDTVTVADALRHPTWRMGAKITIDSATLMNKGLEIIEATWLFSLPEDRIDVVIHPQSVVHSLAEMRDGSVLAQLGPPDMRLPIQLALSWPERWASPVDRLNLAHLGALEFFPPDHAAFPAIGLAREASRRGGTFPAVLNAANEEAVGRFLAGEIRFSDIWRLTADVLARWAGGPAESLGAVKEADQWARRTAQAWRPAGREARPC
jgi:1-deoxy-D-xylulose-5-phosphate reductoisomerase